MYYIIHQYAKYQEHCANLCKLLLLCCIFSIELKCIPSARVTLPVASPTVGMRDAMEDTMAITPALLGENSAIFSVFDGHYGKRAAVYASKHLHDVIRGMLCNIYSLSLKDLTIA